MGEIDFELEAQLEMEDQIDEETATEGSTIHNCQNRTMESFHKGLSKEGPASLQRVSFLSGSIVVSPSDELSGPARRK